MVDWKRKIFEHWCCVHWPKETGVVDLVCIVAEHRHPMVWPDDQGWEDDCGQLACRAFAAWSKPLRILAQPAVCILYPVCELIACTSFMLCLATASWWNTHFRSCYVCVCYAHNILTNKHSFHKIFEPWNRTVLETWLKWLRVNFLNSMNHPFLSIFSLKKCILIQLKKS